MYNKIVLDHFKNPRNNKTMKNPDAIGMGASQICGDVMTLFLKIEEGKIKDASFTTVGCGAAIAAGSVLTEILKGRDIKDAKKISNTTITEAIGGLPAIKLHCPDLAIEALHTAFKDWERKK